MHIGGHPGYAGVYIRKARVFIYGFFMLEQLGNLPRVKLEARFKTHYFGQEDQK